MPESYMLPTLSVSPGPAAALAVDLLVFPVFEDDDWQDQPGLDAATGGEISHARERGELRGRPYDVLITTSSGGYASRRVALVGAGTRQSFTADRLRRIATTAGLAARSRRLATLAVVHRPGTAVSPEMAAQVIAEGVILASFDGGSYKTGEPKAWLASVAVVIESASDAVTAAL